MRPSTITLTYDHYGHLFEGQEADAVQELSQLLVTESPEVVRATGTDDQYCGNEGAIDSYIQTHAPRSAGPRARARVEKKAQRAGRESLQSGATVCEDKGGIEPTQLLPNPLRLTEIDDTLRITATECDAAAPLAQLAEQLTLNQ